MNLSTAAPVAAELPEPAGADMDQAEGLRAMFTGELDRTIEFLERALRGFRVSAPPLRVPQTPQLLAILRASPGSRNPP